MASQEFLQMMISFVVLALVATCSRSQLILNNLSDDTQSCESSCAAAYSDETPDLNACKKGCRLMTIIDFMEEQATFDELLSDCRKTCHDAYGSDVNASSCAFGCQGQMPAIDGRRKQMKAFYDEEAPFLSPLIPVHIYFGRMMDCMMDHVRHEMTMAMMLLSASGQQGQVIVIHAKPAGDFDPEYKTSNYFETNLVLADSGATPDVKRSQMMAASSEADLVVTDKRSSAESDWLTCFAAKIGLSRMSLLFVLLMFFIVILWLCISSMTTSTKLSDIPTQKLSIYGDSDYLLPFNEKVHFSYVKPQEPSVMAPELPVKILIQEI